MPTPFAGRWSLLAFGFAFAFFSSFGQTSFIAVFGGAIRADFALSNAAWGSLYFLGTLASGLLITKVGGLIDSIPLRRYALSVVSGLGLAAAVMAVAPNWVVLVGAIFLLRFFGQGLMSHVAITTMARGFDTARGRAIAIATLGAPAGEAVFPALATLALLHFGWRGSWLAASAVCFVIVLPLAPLLLGGHGRDAASPRTPFAALRFLVQPDMLLALPTLMAPGFISTAIAFHQVLVATSKGWEPALFARAFAVFGAASIVAGLTAGWLVDRMGARRLATTFLLPLGVACMLLAGVDESWVLIAYMVLLGASNGSYAAVTTSLLAEAFGLERLGSIRATAAAVMVVSTALSPMLFGALVDLGVPVDALIAALGLIAFAASGMLSLSGLGCRDRGRQ